MKDVTKEMVVAEAMWQAREILSVWGAGTEYDKTQIEALALCLEEMKNNFACKAAGIMGDDPSNIESLVWYKSDGWNHGGHAITWKERAEELEEEVKLYRKRLEFLAGKEFNVDRGAVGHSDRYYIGYTANPLSFGTDPEEAVDMAIEAIEREERGE